MAYLHSPAYNVAFASLLPLVPQPRTDATVQPVLHSHAVSGTVHEQGAFIVLLYSMFEDAAQLQALYAQLTLTSALQAPGTWWLPDHAFTWRRYNGLVVRPEMGQDIKRDNYFIRDGSFLIKNLVAL